MLSVNNTLRLGFVKQKISGGWLGAFDFDKEAADG